MPFFPANFFLGNMLLLKHLSLLWSISSHRVMAGWWKGKCLKWKLLILPFHISCIVSGNTAFIIHNELVDAFRVVADARDAALVQVKAVCIKIMSNAECLACSWALAQQSLLNLSCASQWTACMFLMGVRKNPPIHVGPCWEWGGDTQCLWTWKHV